MTLQTPTHVLILGAGSGIAEATARLYACEHAVIGLAGRRPDRLAVIASDLKARGAGHVETFEVDFTAPDAAASFAMMVERLVRIDHVILAYGVLGEQARAEHDADAANAIIDVNFRSAAAWALAVANVLERQGHGSLVVLGSVAGDRGRRSNYVYGAAKAGIAVLVQGISHRFRDNGPRAIVVKPARPTPR